MKRIWLLLVMALRLAFALHTLLLIDATALWSYELYSVGKRFQSSFMSMLVMLREDIHPPAYYALLWLWGHLVGQRPVELRSLSWLASSGTPQAKERKLKHLQSQVVSVKRP